jgi:hypothetical protein
MTPGCGKWSLGSEFTSAENHSALVAFLDAALSYQHVF